MNVYLDNNVYVDIEYRELNLLDFISKDIQAIITHLK